MGASKHIQPDDKADQRRGIDYIGVCASFVVHDGKGRILLQKRGAEARDEQGRWDVGGGAVEFDETPAETVRREIREEYCCEALDVEFLVAYDAHRQLDDGTKTHWVAMVHAVRIDPTKVTIGEPHKISEVGWFTSDDLPEPLHSQFWKSFECAQARDLVR
ncbi:MAG TPA: NUDIX domain-containing protein [Verrucomicrobiae bacterium]|jgi:8-oxo-dGTP diphosphatase|nr:NUDIX domain-containing protein [Verrucomicrobiae bacterium]